MHQMSIHTQAAVAKSSVITGSGYTSLLLLKEWEENAQETVRSLVQDIWLHKRNQMDEPSNPSFLLHCYFRSCLTCKDLQKTI